MTTKIQLFVLFIFIPILGFSQESNIDSILQYWFPVSIEETERIVEGETPLYDKEWNFKTAYSFPTNISEKNVFDELPYGQYICAKADNSFVKTELKFHSNLDIGLLDNRKNKWIVIVDEKGNRLQVDEVRQGKDVLKYSNEYQGYLLNKTKKYQRITYEYKNIIGFYDLEKERRNNYGNIWQRFRRTIVGRIIILYPKRFFRRVFSREEREYRRDRRDEENNSLNNYHPSYNGYVALNQPKFSHGDSLKVKGYFIKMKNGKPCNKPLNVLVGENRYGELDTVFQKIIYPDVPGRYLLDMEIGDSLMLDKNYKIVFELKGGKKKERWVKDFYVEDYELDDVEYTFGSVKDDYEKGDKIILKADAKYTTGKRVPNAQVKIKLLSSEPSEYLVDSLVIPDTLWTHTHELNFTDETQIIVPDSILPKARMNIKCVAEFSTLDGEIQQNKLNFSINKSSGIETEGELFLSYESGYILGEYKENDTIVETKAILKQVTERGDFYESVQLPFKIKYNPFVQKIQLQKENHIEKINHYSIKDNGINLSGNKTNDSIFIELNNSYELDIHYVLLYGGNILEEGIVKDSIWQYNNKSIGDENYYISYSYIWTGNTTREWERFQLNQNQLDIKIEQVTEAEPGDEIDVKIKVKDQKGNPVKDVELIAASLSSKFKDDFSKAYEVPRIQRQKSKYPKWKKKYRLSQLYSAKNVYHKKTINEEWFNQLNLNSSMNYRFRFPQNGLHMEYIPLPEKKDSFAQFIPLIVNEGSYQKPYAVHYNRQAIYYEDVDDNDYVFIGENGKQDITIRLNDSEIELKDIELRTGYKLVFSIEKDSIRNESISNVSFSKKPRKWERKESVERGNSLMFVERESGDELYIWEAGKRVFYINSGGSRRNEYLVGPFRNTENINFIKQKEFQKKIKFEPSFIYDVEENRERLYHYDFIENDKNKTFRYGLFTPDIHAFALIGKEIKFVPKSEYIEPTEPFSHLYGNRLLDYDAKTNLKIDFSGNRALVWAAIHTETKENYIFSPNTKRVENLPEGTYEIIYMFKHGYISKTIGIKNHHQSFLRINNSEGRLNTNDFREKTKTALRPGFNWEESIFYTGEQKIIGMRKMLKGTDFSQSIVKAKKKAKVYRGPKRMVSGIVTEESGEPLIGANVVVDGYEEIGTVTEFDGSFSIMVPIGSEDLVITYTGFFDTQMNVGNMDFVSVSLTQGELLSEVVVTSLYITRQEKSLGYAVEVVGSREITKSSPLTTMLSGKVAGVQTMNANGRPGNADYIQLRGAASISGKKQPLYVINGTPVSAEIFAAMNPDEINNVSVLKDESATAIYGVAGANGVIVITTTDNAVIPTAAEAKNILEGFQIRENFSDYAYWQPRLVTDKNGEAHFTAQLPDDITGWETYVLGLDRKNRAGVAFHNTASYKKLMAELSAPRFAIEGDVFNIIGQSVNYTQDSFAVNTTFKLEDKIIQNQSGTIVTSLAEQAEIIVPTDKDSLHFQYELSTGKYGDGEKRNLPVFKKGIIENVGEFKVLNNNETFNFQAAYDVPTKISIQDNKMDVLLESIDYLKNYKYGCAEQTSSKLIALLLEKDLNKKLGKEFKDDKKINKNIIRLSEMQNDAGSWGWWKGNDGIPWITLYVIEALQMANKAGFETLSLDDGLDYIAQRNHLEKPAHQLKAMDLLIADGTNIDSLEVMKYDTMKLNISDYLLHTKVKQQLGYKIDLDSVQQLLTSTTYGAKYIDKKNNYWYYDNMNQTLLAYDIFKAAEEKKITEAIELYFYSEKKNKRWSNTIHTAQILQRLLPDTKINSTDSKIFINGKVINEFPYVAKSNNEIVEIKQEGTTPFFVDVSQEIHVPNPKEKKNVFEVKTYFQQENKTTEFLKKSVATKLIVEVNAKQEGDYIMLEIPIPAGCSYGTKIQNRWGVESHREYHKNKVIIFCTRLPKGKNVFTINVEPRFTGKYTLNPVRVEEMYAPSIFGRNQIRKLEIRD